MPIHSINAATAKAWLDAGEALLVDVREPAEHASESIPGATLVPLGTVRPSNLPQAAGKKLIIHCRKGGRGNTACMQLLQESPNLEVYNLDGGIEAWAASGLPVHSSSGKKILPLDRQVQLTIGLTLLTGSVLGILFTPVLFFLTGFIGLGLTVAGLTGFCGLARVLAIMPWNRRTAAELR